jgi:hypothetical protein
MSPNRLNDRDQISLLLPSADRRDDVLVQAVVDLGGEGSVYHLLAHIPEQGEDIYTVLIDDHSVACFELSREDGSIIRERASVISFDQYRSQIGQGKRRIRLDKAAANARELVKRAASDAGRPAQQ